MGNIKIIVGKHCMEHSEITLPLCSKYTLISTDLAISECQCMCPASIQSISLSPIEMADFLSFFSENANLQKLGFSESSLLFVALRQKIRVAVIDNLTEGVCKQLGIEILKIKRHSANHITYVEDEKGFKSSHTSLLSDILRAACL